MAADALVVVLTWTKTVQTMGPKFRWQRMPLMTVMVSDGTLCFMVLLILNIISLAVWHDVFYSNPMTMWISIFTGILTCRFMLDLRQAAVPGDETGMSQLTTIHFRECPRNTCEGQCPDAVRTRRDGMRTREDVLHLYLDDDDEEGSECAEYLRQ